MEPVNLKKKKMIVNYIWLASLNPNASAISDH